MRYQLEYHPNPDCLSIHVSSCITKKSIERFDADQSMDDGQQPRPRLIDDLFKIDGITAVTLQRYEIGLAKGTVFEWKEIMPIALEVLNINLNGMGVIEEKGKPIHYKINDAGFREDLSK